MNRILLICLAALLITGQSLQGQINLTVNPVGAGMSEEALDKYEAYLKSEIEAKNLPGAVSLIMSKGQIDHSEAYGYSNISTQAPMTTDKIFYIQSMTKPIISIAFMTLYEEGKFFLTDPVSKYIPEFADLKVIQVTPTELPPT